MDSKRAVLYEEGLEFALKHKLTFIETSAKTASNVEAAFTKTAEKIYENIKTGTHSLILILILTYSYSLTHTHSLILTHSYSLMLTHSRNRFV